MKLVAEGRLKRQLKFNKIKPELAPLAVPLFCSDPLSQFIST